MDLYGLCVVLWLFVLIKNARCTGAHSARTEIRSWRFVPLCIRVYVYV